MDYLEYLPATAIRIGYINELLVLLYCTVPRPRMRKAVKLGTGIAFRVKAYKATVKYR